MADTARELLLKSIKSSLTTGEFSDLTTTCGDAVFKVHKLIVCPRSGFLARSLKFPGKEAHNNNIINLPEDDPDNIKLMIQYLYESDYDHPPISVPQPGLSTPTTGLPSSAPPYTFQFPHSCPSNTQNLVFICPHHLCGGIQHVMNFTCRKCKHVHSDRLDIKKRAAQLLTHVALYGLADKYMIAGLKNLARNKFLLVCESFYDSPSFPTAVHYVFSSTPDSDKRLRDIVCTTISNHLGLLDKSDIETLMNDLDGLAFGVLKVKRRGEALRREAREMVWGEAQRSDSPRLPRFPMFQELGRERSEERGRHRVLSISGIERRHGSA